MKKDKFDIFVGKWMHFEDTVLSKINQTCKYCMLFPI